jgi:hypothetical protein
VREVGIEEAGMQHRLSAKRWDAQLTRKMDASLSL